MSSALSFHCMICFEEFDNETLYPVVLPCGHTYICVQCAGRIDKCMECRASLFAPSTDNDNKICSSSEQPRGRGRFSNSSTLSAARSGRRPAYPHQGYHSQTASGNNPKVHPKPKTRLPLPKNVVLMSLIEASQMANAASSRMLMNTDSADESEESKILLSTELATSSCGTYAVRRKEGLKIVPTMNGRSLRSTRQIFGDDQISSRSLTRRRSKSNSSNHGQEMHLSYGDRVQVVTVVDHWAKLARGYGYIYFANSSDLVKVAGVLDKACNIESMLYALSFRRNHMIHQKSKIEKDAIKLMQELQITMIDNEDLTVIGADAFEGEDKAPEETRDDKLLINSSSLERIAQLRDSSSSESLKMDQTPAAPAAATRQPPTPWDPTTDFMDWIRSFYPTNEPPRERTEQPKNKALVASAESWRRRNGREAQSGINFRTGLSGHLGSQSHHATVHARDEFDSVPKLSGHSGLTPNRRKAGRKQTRRYSEDSVDQLSSTKSME